MEPKAIDNAWVKRNFLNYKVKGSFSGASGFIRNRDKWKEKDYIQKQLNKIEAYSRHKDIRNKYPRRRIMVNFAGEIYSADLKDISNLSRYNNGKKFLLIVVDAFSKMGYVRALNDKTAGSVIKGFNSILRESKKTPVFLYVDMGKEFVNKDMKQWLKERKIKMYHIHSTVKSAFSERYIRTIFTKLQRYMTAKNTYKFIDKLQDFVHTQNRTYVRTIGRAPIDVTQEDSYEIWEKLFGSYIERQKKKRKPAKFHVHDLVRISRAKLTFEKGEKLNQCVTD